MSIPSLASLIKRRDLSGVVSDTVSYLASYQQKKVLFITTSTRYPFNTAYDKGGVEDELPKSTELALFIKNNIPNKSSWIDIPQLKIVSCEGNVSHKTGNSCGVMDSVLNDKKKNPSGNHRCWASVNDKSDQLWKVSDEIFNKRKEICLSCPSLGKLPDSELGFCNSCGCGANPRARLDVKLTVAGTECPLNKWGREKASKKKTISNICESLLGICQTLWYNAKQLWQRN